MRRRSRAFTAAAALALAVASAAAARVGFPRPTVYSVAPEAVCHSEIATVHYPPGQSGPAKKRIPSPAAPGLKASASGASVRVDWSLRRTPATCRTDGLLLSIGRYPRSSGDEWLPITVFIETHGAVKGSKRISWSSPQPPDIALASALMRRGGRSRVVAVLIRR